MSWYDDNIGFDRNVNAELCSEYMIDYEEKDQLPPTPKEIIINTLS